MSKIDLNLYFATADQEDGPLIVQDMNGQERAVEPYRDEEGNVTLGGQIGYALAYILMVAFVLLGFYVI